MKNAIAFAGLVLLHGGVAFAQQIKGSETLLIGDSFIALSHNITLDLEQLVRQAGILGSNDNFRDNSVSGTWLACGPAPTIPTQYDNAMRQSAVKYVVMDGGGNDMKNSTCSNPPTANCQAIKDAVNAAKTLFAKMGTDGVLKVVYFFYANPVNDSGLQAKLDVLRPLIQNVVQNSVSPIGYWLDLRPVFAGKYSQYILSDGIHPTPAGCQATAQAIWDLMKANNFYGTTASIKFSTMELIHAPATLRIRDLTGRRTLYAERMPDRFVVEVR